MTGQREATPATSARQVARAAAKVVLPELSEQARNAKDDDRASPPFVATEERKDPLARGCVTLGFRTRPRLPCRRSPRPRMSLRIVRDILFCVAPSGNILDRPVLWFHTGHFVRKHKVEALRRAAG